MSALHNRSVAPALVLIAGLLLVIVLRPTGVLGPVEDVLTTLFAPLQYTLDWAGSRIGGTLQSLRELSTVQARVRELEETVDRLMIENVRLREAEVEVAQLRDLLQFKQANPTLEILAAEVIGRDPSNLMQYVLIDRGTQDGIATGMPVMTARGLVGRITAVFPHSARVMLLTDLASAVNALVQSSRATGIVQGQGRQGLTMQYVEQREDVLVGDVVLTSGLGSNFPKRLVIGQVTSVMQSDVDMFQEIQVQSAVYFDRLETVLVIQSFAPSETAP